MCTTSPIPCIYPYRGTTIVYFYDANTGDYRLPSLRVLFSQQ